MNPEIIDNINKPSHYIGTYGLEVKDVTKNFRVCYRRHLHFLWNRDIKKEPAHG